MIVNMACPKCGGQATEYDENKWSCLMCGNKFIFAPEQPSQTIIQSNVHIEGQAAFELDTANMKPPVPGMVKMAEHDPDYFADRIKDNAHEIRRLEQLLPGKKIKKYVTLLIFLGLVFVLGSVVLAAVFAEPHDRDTVGDGIIACIIFGVPAVVLFFAYRYFSEEAAECKAEIKGLQQQRLSMEKQNQMDTKIGDHVVCPYCAAASVYVALKSLPPAEGLKHCLKCGRQFFTSGLNSYPVLFKQ